MENAQRELMDVLIGRLLSLDLISKTTYSKALDLVHSAIDLPEPFWYPVCLKKEAGAYEYSQNTQ